MAILLVQIQPGTQDLKSIQRAKITAPQTLLVIATRRLGDVLLTTPLLRSLREAWPDARIDILVFRHTGSVLAGNPDISRIIEIEERPDRRQHLQLFRRIARRYDLAISTLGGDRPCLYALIAAPTRVGIIPDAARKNAWKRWICTGWALLDNINTHTVVQYLRLADVLGIPGNYTVVPPRDIGTDEPACHVQGIPPDLPYAVIHPYPMYRYKRWTIEGWRQLIESLLHDGLLVVITGGPDKDECRFCAELADEFDRGVINTAGQYSFAGLTDLLSASSCYIGPDTSVTHLAAACGIPVIALYGPSNPVKWGPWPVGDELPGNSPFTMRHQPWQRRGNVTLVQGVGNCVPCHEEGCDRHRGSYSRCLDELPAATVLAALKDALDRQAPDRN